MIQRFSKCTISNDRVYTGIADGPPLGAGYLTKGIKTTVENQRQAGKAIDEKQDALGRQNRSQFLLYQRINCPGQRGCKHHPDAQSVVTG